LARIAALTAGPTNISRRAGSTKNITDYSRNTASSSLLLTSMSNKNAEGQDYFDDEQNYLLGENGKEQNYDTSISTTLQFAQATSAHLARCIENATPVGQNLSRSIEICHNLMNRHTELLQHSGELSAAADRLQMEEQILSKKAKEIGSPLEHYDAMDKMGVLMGVLFKDQGNTVVRGLAKVKVDSEEYTELLDQIDAAVAFFMEQYQHLSVHHANHQKKIEQEIIHRTEEDMARMNDRDRRRAERERAKRVQEQRQSPLTGSVVEYYKRSVALHEAALFLIREAVVDRIAQTTQDIIAALNLNIKPVSADKLEASLIYTRFHGISSRSNSLIGILRDRLHMDPNQSYLQLLTFCQSTYSKSREHLLKLTVKNHLESLKDQHGLISLTRLASVFLIRICTVETMLYLDFFAGDYKSEKEMEDALPQNNNSPATKNPNMEVPLKPSYKRKKSKTEKAAILATQDPYFQKHLSNLCVNLQKTVRRGLISATDLDTLCQIVSVLREEWQLANSSKNTISTARALSGVIQDAQERLIFCANAALSKDVGRFKATPADLDYPNKLHKRSNDDINNETETETKTETEQDGEEGKHEKGLKTGGDDAVQEQLRVYESWFPPMRSVLRVLSKIFRVVEPQVFEDIAQQSVQSCTRSLKEGASVILGNSGIIHSDLFLVKHLLILREQLSPFDIQLRAVERQLDFSDTGKAVTKFLANRNRKLFSMTNENALVTLLREGVSVQESSVDSKRDLEDSLRSACNDFIEHTSTTLAKDLLHFVNECKNVIANAGNLRDAPFMKVDVILDTMSAALASLTEETKFILEQMGLYLENQATQSILIKPVARKLMRAIEDSKRYINQVSGDDEEAWDDESNTRLSDLFTDIEAKVKALSSVTRVN